MAVGDKTKHYQDRYACYNHDWIISRWAFQAVIPVELVKVVFIVP